MLDAFIIEKIRREQEQQDSGRIPLRIRVPDAPPPPPPERVEDDRWENPWDDSPRRDIGHNTTRIRETTNLGCQSKPPTGVETDHETFINGSGLFQI